MPLLHCPKPGPFPHAAKIETARRGAHQRLPRSSGLFQPKRRRSEEVGFAYDFSAGGEWIRTLSFAMPADSVGAFIGDERRPSSPATSLSVCRGRPEDQGASRAHRQDDRRRHAGGVFERDRCGALRRQSRRSARRHMAMGDHRIGCGDSTSAADVEWVLAI